ISSVLKNAVANAVGVVSVGDDAAFMAKDAFGFVNVQNGPLPMGNGSQFQNLWVSLEPTSDVPQLPGIITNSINKILTEPKLNFKPFGGFGIISDDYRCSADADRYDVLPTYLQELSFMGFQRGQNATGGITGGAKELSVIAAFGNGTRRGVTLSFQPQDLVEKSAAEQIVYDAIMWASFAHQGFKVDVPVADPAGKEFEFMERVQLSVQTVGAEIYYRLNPLDAYQKYAGETIELTETTTIEAFGQKEGYVNSDTISENYVKTSYNSVLEVTKIGGEPLGGSSYLTELDDKFIIRITTPYATLSEVSLNITSTTGKDAEVITITNPENTGKALVFIDTVDFAVVDANLGNSIVEAASYDVVQIDWVNSLNSVDQLSTSFNVRQTANPGQVYFSDINWNPVTRLNGDETTLYVVVEDQIFDPARLSEYVVTLSNSKGDNNTSPVDKETYVLTEIQPGKYGAIISVTQSPPVKNENKAFEIRIGDDLKAHYVDPVDKMEANDSKGYGAPNQQPGKIAFTNADYTTPVQLSTSGNWEASAGKVYLYYEDDYVAAISQKTILMTVTSTDGQGKPYEDRELVKLNLFSHRDSIGIWKGEVALDDNPMVNFGDGKLQFYFFAEIKAEVATHKNGTEEKLSGDTARAMLNTAYGNLNETITIKDAVTGTEINRFTTRVKVCVEDQVFSAAVIDTILLEKVQCSSSGDQLKQIRLVQGTPGSNLYCGTFTKEEAISGTLTDTILHCQDIDNLSAKYTDPVYGTEERGNVTIMDATSNQIQFLDLLGKPVIGSISEDQGNELKIRLTHKTPDLYKKDTLRVKLTADSGDTLDILVYETGIDNGIFEATFTFAFSLNPYKNNNILEGVFDPEQINNQMTIIGKNGGSAASIVINSSYVPAERAWIVDGNSDGQGDSIYIQFKAPVYNAPTAISSIDWPYEGAQGHIAENDPFNSEQVISLHRLLDQFPFVHNISRLPNLYL
ncbi:MAG: chitobiase/beta-hexosaminidase C-terminal domain-containing protein, partial [Fibrobacteria bacterium]|nr:chitobiase/beta-hexosaminidase C-terminal domain-containing protein [Fibrobacteria bacterium]